MSSRLVHIFNSGMVSGPETLVLPALAEIGRKIGFEVSVIFLTEKRLSERGREPARYAQGLGLNVIEVPVRGRLDRSAAQELSERLRKLDAQIAHAHDVKASFYLWLASRGKPQWKTVSTHHGVHGRPDLKTRLYECFYSGLILRCFDLAIAVSRSDFDELLRRGVPRDRLRLLQNGVDRPEVPAAERAQRAFEVRSQAWGLSLPSETLVLGYIGRLSKEKRVDRILDMLAVLNSKSAGEWVLLIFGEGSEEAFLRERAEKLELQEQIRWMGYRSTVGTETAGLDLLVLLSDHEGIPVVVLEAGWGGTPVFATSVGGLPEVIRNGEDGVLVDPSSSPTAMAEKLQALLVDAKERERLGNNFRSRVRDAFSGSAWREKLADLYRSIHR